MPGKHYNKNFGKSPMTKKSSGFKMKGMEFGEGTGSSASKNADEKSGWGAINEAARRAATGGTNAEGFGQQGSFANFAGEVANVAGQYFGGAQAGGEGDGGDGMEDAAMDAAKMLFMG